MPGMKWMMYLMPLMFLFWFNNYASGLSYYYFVSLLITIIQTYSCRLFVTEDKVRATIAANAATWMGFPLNESKSLGEAFGSFPVLGDIVKSKDGSSTYNGSIWRGGLTGLQPGQGYIYKSASGEDRTFTFGTEQ